jgi:translation initiation factor 5B
MKKGKKGEKKKKKDQDTVGVLARDLNDTTAEQGREDKQQSKKAAEKFATEPCDEDSRNTSKLLNKSKAGYNAPAVENEGNSSKKNATLAPSVNSDNIIKMEEKRGKKKDKQRRKRQDDDEDIEKILAELEMEYSGIKKVVVQEEPQKAEDISASSWRKDKKEKKKSDTEKREPLAEESQKETKEIVGGEEIEGTVRTAAQKRKEKKEKKLQEKIAQKEQEAVKKIEGSEAQKLENRSVVSVGSGTKAALKAIEDREADVLAVPEKGDYVTGDRKEKRMKIVEEEETGKNKRRGPGKKAVAAMQAALRRIHEEEERLANEEAERIKKEEESKKAQEEQRQLEIERKRQKKLKEKERKERLKAEGKLLTAKEKADYARAQGMLEALIAQGLEMPSAREKKAPRPGTRVRIKAKQQTSIEEQQKPEEQKVEVQIIDSLLSEKKELDEVKDACDQEEDVKDAWDDESPDEDEVEEHSDKSKGNVKLEVTKREKEDEKHEEGKGEDDKSYESMNEEDNDSEVEHKTNAERQRRKALARIQARREEAENNRSCDVLRAAVVCVLGHVDTGKTKILDKLRHTNIQDGEAGGITQQIGATNVPISAIIEQTKFVKGFVDAKLKIPGLLIIDTPGHESFSNLRSRGSSLCDIAILVVDIMHGLEPQTIESLNLLRSKKTPFIVALNKIDRLYDWQTMNKKDIRDILKAQAPSTQLEFKHRTEGVVVQFAEQGLNASLFYDNLDVRKYVSLVPTSAITGEGIGNLLALIIDSCQNMLAKRLTYSEELQATVLEVKAIPGLGTTIDTILVNGRLREGDTIVLAGTDGPIVTQIRSLLMPQPMRELRVKNAYVEYKEIQAAQGIKIAGKELEKAIAGLNLQVAQKPDEVDILREEVSRDLRSALSNIKLQERGVYVQASTLGSLEALLEFLRTSKIPYSNIRIGPVVKKDVMKASTMLEHESQFATILAFDVKVERDAQDLADSLGVMIFQADIIYNLFDMFVAYREELRQRKREEFKHIAVFPCRLKVLPQFIFNSRDPIVIGVMIEAGIVKQGTPICVPSREFVDLGVVTSIEVNHREVQSARKGQEVCIKIEPISSEAPKMFGRHFDEKDFLVSKISRQSIDACKDYFRDDLLQTDWKLMIELKNLFQIL